MAAVVAGAAALAGRPAAALATTGALCVSIVDQPGPFRTKARLFALDILAATSVTLLAALAGRSPWLLGPLIALTSAATAMTSAFGRRALGVGVTMVLALLFGMAAPPDNLRAEIGYAVVFACGGIAYALIALVITWTSDERTRKLFLGEAMLAFSRYVAAKAALYGAEARPRAALGRLVDAHAELVERLQAARDMIFTGRRTRWIAALIALLEAFDTILSSDADVETLQDSEHRHLMRRLHALLTALAGDIHALAVGFLNPAGDLRMPAHASELKAIADEIARVARMETPDVTAFRATAHKLGQTIQRLQMLADALDPHLAEPKVPDALVLQPFVAVTRTGFGVLKAQTNLSSPVARYAIRLTLAMVAGFALTLVFPNYIHGGWVLLTTALIMRANYSITRRRRDDRVLGNLAGCFAVMLLVRALPADALAAIVVVAIATSHAFGAVNYRVTAFAACISALLQLHFVSPLAQPMLFERMLDTLIGAGLAWGFSYVLPSWEKRNIPRLLRAMTAADKAYATQALLREADDQAMRLARKKAHDAAANLSMTVRRLADEPDLDRRALVALQELLAANYLLASDLASMRVLFRRRRSELEPGPSDALLAETSRRVQGAFAGAAKDTPDTLSRYEGTGAAMALKRRLVHIERASARVSALGTRALALMDGDTA
ncbi:MAG TPA: FUSC family membrane protein [Rhizomicrobium sp.]|nr:FUSC family membrane protein [Rhizomicrobium sp.]